MKARYCKLKKRRRVDMLPEHTQKQVALVNSEAVRQTDIIDLESSKRVTVKRDVYKKWLPRGLLRLCFSQRKRACWSASRGAFRKRLERGVKHKIAKTKATPQSRSTQSLAERFKASTTYLQAAQDSVAQVAVKSQFDDALLNIPAARCVFRLACDETEQKVSFAKRFKFFNKTVSVNQTISSFVAHGNLRIAPLDGTQASIVSDIVLPLLALASKTSNCMMYTLCLLLGNFLQALNEGARIFALIVNSDFASTNRLLFRQILTHFKPALGLHARCFMHQIALACGVAAKALRLIGPLFCGSTLLHYGDAQEHLSRALEQWLSGRKAVAIVYTDERTDAAKTYWERLLDLLHWDEALLSTEALRRSPLGRKKLDNLIEQLGHFLHGDISSRQWAHFCPHGCCRSLSDTKSKLLEILQALFLHHAPPVPALNRWTQLYPALAWWCVTIHIHGMIAKLWADVYSKTSKDKLDEDAAMVDYLAPISDEALSTIRSKRAAKTLRWISHPNTPDELAVMCMGHEASVQI